jgi:hypothetical protein
MSISLTVNRFRRRDTESERVTFAMEVKGLTARYLSTTPVAHRA